MCLVSLNHPIKDPQLAKPWQTNSAVQHRLLVAQRQLIASFTFPVFLLGAHIFSSVTKQFPCRLHSVVVSETDTSLPVALRTGLRCHIYRRESPRARWLLMWFSTPCWLLRLNVFANSHSCTRNQVIAFALHRLHVSKYTTYIWTVKAIVPVTWDHVDDCSVGLNDTSTSLECESVWGM